MKVSIDGILGSARRINQQKQPEEERSDDRKKEIRTDTLSISKKINSRLDFIEKEFHEIQSSLTKNQILGEGIDRLRENLTKGGGSLKDILDETKFEGNNILRAYIGESVTREVLYQKNEMLGKNINRDIDRLKTLQVELDNIMAAGLTGESKVENILSNIDSVFAEKGHRNLENITSLHPDSVMKLIK